WKTQVAIHTLNQTNQVLHFAADLFPGDEAVCIVLRELPNSGQPGKNTRRFVAMQRRLLVETQRQIAIAPHFAAEDKHVTRTVHALGCGDHVSFVLRVERNMLLSHYSSRTLRHILVASVRAPDCLSNRRRNRELIESYPDRFPSFRTHVARGRDRQSRRSYT